MMSKWFTIIFIAFVTCKLNATIYYVNDASTTGDVFTGAIGSAANSGTLSSSPKLTLSSILTTYTLVSGDIIYIDAGTYNSSSDVNMATPCAGLTFMGAGMNLTIFEHASALTNKYFMHINHNNTILSSFRLRGYNGEASSAGMGQVLGINTNITGVQINNILLDYGAPSGNAGGYPIEVFSGAGVVFNGGGATCMTGSGSAPYGGGIEISGATTNVTIKNYVFGYSSRSSDPVDGAALKINNGTVNIYNTAILSNTVAADHNGAGIAILSGTVNIYDSKVDGNMTKVTTNGSTLVGSGIKISGGIVRITRSIISNNKDINSGGSGSYGGGIGVIGGTVILDSCKFTGNLGCGSCSTKPNDVYVGGGSVLARYCIFGSTPDPSWTTTKQIWQSAGTFTIANSGSPTQSGTITQTNTITSTYTANPSVNTPTGTCSSTAYSLQALPLTILPIELTRFEGYCNNGGVILTWQTASEKNNKVFYIERSIDGISFEVIGTIRGAGNSENYNNYSFIDSEKLDVISYYRLSQFDFDGKNRHSKIISVEHVCVENLESELTVYPNPTSINTNLSLKLMKRSSVNVEIYNSIGQLTKSIPFKIYDAGLQDIIIESGEFPAGVYFIKTFVDKREYIQKFIKL